VQAITSRADADYKIQLILTWLTLLLFELKIVRKVSNHERDVPKGPLPKKLSPLLKNVTFLDKKTWGDKK
jgi:hypothetical protein